ncbi:MAG: ATP-dependent Clp protease ATP-binding subunit [Patescibacteria group bacterium]|jgi:ATP-dependent Clp protease ATP-binding subunit ClpA
MSDLVDKFSPHLNTALTRALTLVLQEGSESITPEHLFWAIGTEDSCLGAQLLKKSGLEAAAFEELTKPAGRSSMTDPKAPKTKPFLSVDAKAAMEKAMLAANLHDHPLVTTEHLLFGILALRPLAISAVFKKAGVDAEKIQEELTQIFRETRAPEPQPAEVRPTGVREVKKAPAQPCIKCGHVHDEVADANEQSALEFFSTELTGADHVKKIDALIGRNMEIDRLARILTRKTKNNPLLLGAPGVGKTAIVEGLAKRIVDGSAPAGLKGTKIYMLDMSAMLAGTMYRGDFEERLHDVIEDLKEAKNAVLFIDEVHTLVGTGSGSGALDAANIMKPSLARGEIRVIGATTREEYKKHIEDDGALARRFAPVSVREPSADETKSILIGLAPAYAKHHGVTFAKEAFATIVEISGRYFPHKAFPDKAIDLLDEVGSACRTKKLDITTDDVRRVAATVTGVPLERLEANDSDKLKTLKSRLADRVLAQTEAVEAVASSIIRAKLGFHRAEKPLASFLFVGPSGVGKTEMAKAVAAEVFEDEKALIRLDMSEYAESFSASKLIGSPPGYVGYKEVARLTDAVKARPYSVVLFDELEKAHKDVHHLLLQILDEGTITDATGTAVNFRNTVIIMTSNAGRELFERGSLGFTGKAIKEKIDMRTILEDEFKAEFLNRIDRICLFGALTPADMEKIAKRELKELELRLKNRGISLKADAAALTQLAKSVNPKLGARDVRRVIAEAIERPLADKVLNNLGKKAKNYRVRAGKKGVEIA